MFCYLYLLHDRTSVPLFEKEKCFEECKHYIDGKCKIASNIKENLSSSRFGWILGTIIQFDTPEESKSKNTKYLSVITLLHPSSPDIWIMKCQRLNKVTDSWYDVYRLHKSGECTEFDDLESLNRWLKKQKFDGRKLTDQDFIKKV